jgi:hypothetical protein
MEVNIENVGFRPDSGGSRVIVGLNVALKGPFPLVGESEMSRFGLF